MANVPATTKPDKANVPATTKGNQANVPATSKRTTGHTVSPAADARVYSGERLGIELPGGRISELAPDRVHMALVGSRILDRTPWTQYPIVVLG